MWLISIQLYYIHFIHITTDSWCSKCQGIGPVPINDMQITSPPIPPPLSKMAKLGFCSKKVEQLSQTFDQTIFLFLLFIVFETWSTLYSKYLENWQKKNNQKRPLSFWSQNMCNVLKRMQNRFSAFLRFYFLR